MSRGNGGSRIFQGEGANSKAEGTNLWFSKMFTENYMKMQEIGPRGETRPWYSPPKIRHCMVNLHLRLRQRPELQ